MVASLERVALADRVANALVAYAVYLRQFAWPSGLAVFYPHPGSGLPLWKPLLAAALLLGLTLLALRSWPRRGYLAVGWLWFLGMLVPTIGLVQVGSQAHADRYMYLPLAGLAIALAWGAPDLCAARARRRVALAGAALLVVALLAVATRLQLRHWHDSVALFEHALAVTEDNHIAHAQLGAAYAEQRTPRGDHPTLSRGGADPTGLPEAAEQSRLAARDGARSRAARPRVRGEPGGARRGALGRAGSGGRSIRSRPPTPRRVASTTRCATEQRALQESEASGAAGARASRCARGSRCYRERQRVSGMTNGDQVHGGAAAQDGLDQRREQTERRADQEGEPQPGAESRLNGGAASGARRCSSV